MQCVSTLANKINRQQSFFANKNTINSPLVRLFNRFFASLKVIFPASTVLLKTQTELDIFKHQWMSGFAENNINSDRHVNAGLRIARQRKSPFLPSVGQFIDWCHQGLAEEYQLPTPDELCAKLQAYCRLRGYDDIHQFDYGSHASYWLVHELYRAMINENLNARKVEEKATQLIDDLTKKLMSGYVIPNIPRALTKNQTSKPVSKVEALKKIEKIKGKYGLGKGVDGKSNRKLTKISLNFYTNTEK